MKKEAKRETSLPTGDNSFGIAAVTLGIFSIMFSYPPLYGIIFGVISLIFANKQQKKSPNAWGRRGKVLAIIGIILSIIFFAFFIWLTKNPEILNQVLGQNAPF